MRYSLNFVRNKDLPAGFDYYFSFYILVSIYFSIHVFLLLQKVRIVFNCSTDIGKTHTKIYKNDIPWRFPGIHHVTEWRTLAWVTIYPWFYCLNPPELKKWPAELRYKVTSRGNTNNADLFPSQGRNIWNKYFIPALYQSPAFEKGFTADNRQNSSARTDDARLILKKDSESA